MRWTRASLVPKHYLNQCWLIVNWSPGNKFSEISIRILLFLFQKMYLKMSSAKMAAILPKGRWVKTETTMSVSTDHSPVNPLWYYVPEICMDSVWVCLVLNVYAYSVVHISHHHDSKVHGANMGPIWGRQDPGGPHVGPMNFAIWACTYMSATDTYLVRRVDKFKLLDFSMHGDSYENDIQSIASFNSRSTLIIHWIVISLVKILSFKAFSK